jgi:hypothetical protein
VKALRHEKDGAVVSHSNALNFFPVLEIREVVIDGCIDFSRCSIGEVPEELEFQFARRGNQSSLAMSEECYATTAVLGTRKVNDTRPALRVLMHAINASVFVWFQGESKESLRERMRLRTGIVDRLIDLGTKAFPHEGPVVSGDLGLPPRVSGLPSSLKLLSEGQSADLVWIIVEIVNYNFEHRICARTMRISCEAGARDSKL